MATGVHAFQIYFDKKTQASLDPDFEPLNNSQVVDTSWYEYHPIRKFLLEETLNESSYYGFLSPRFHEKTHLTGRQVIDFVRDFNGDADVVTFSPHPCFSSCFVNVFEQADFFSQGLYEDCAEFFRLVDPNTRLKSIVNDSRNTVFCNYFFAKPRFWRVWKEILDLIIEQSSSPLAPLSERLNREIPYVNGDGVSRPVGSKIFVMERAVSFLLSRNHDFSVTNFPPFQLPVMSPFQYRAKDLMMLDDLKISYSKSGDARLLASFKKNRDQLIESVWPSAPPRLFGSKHHRNWIYKLWQLLQAKM